MKPRYKKILHYWFGRLIDEKFFPAAKARIWFGGGKKVDRDVRKRFRKDLLPALRGKYDGWCKTPHGRLALIVLLDQFPRNMFRGLAEAFAYDKKALSTALKGIKRGDDLKLYPVERIFFYLPLEHAENLAVQKKSVKLFGRLYRESPPSVKTFTRQALDYAKRHERMIRRFGRFPYRNDILGRPSTLREKSFLKRPGSSF